ncbi:MAG: hypothetical protein ACI9RO_000136 [Alteromonas macleodii]|jgi:hypothetical protein
MKIIKILVMTFFGLSVASCTIEGGQSLETDSWIDAKNLTQLVAGIWVDPNGCDHWMIDDGLEGYLSERLTPDGRPVCSGVAPSSTVTGPFQAGSKIPDIL